jgi:hypothetical protein
MNYKLGIVQTTVEYKFDNHDTQTATLAEQKPNSAWFGVSYRDMSTSHSLGVELILANGDKLVFDLNPTDPVLRAFTDICKQQYKEPNSLY